MTERDSISGPAANPQWVFDTVYDTYFPQLQYFATGLTGDKEEARDIVIRVFQLLWNMRANFDTATNVRAFLYITTRNNCFNYLKSRQRHDAGNLEYEYRLSQAADEKSVEMRIMEAELMELIHQTIAKLPNRCREIFELTYFEGLKAGDIAKKLNISTSTVTTQRSIAIKHLKAVLSEEDFLVFLLLLNSGMFAIPHLG